MRKLLMVALLTVSLTACGGRKEPPKPVGQKKTAETGKEIDVEGYGTYKKVFEKKDLNLVQKTGPFIVKINKVKISELKFNEISKPEFGGKDKATAVVIDMTLENTEEKTNTLHAGLSTIVTNTKEQKEADSDMSGDIGGDFMGKVKKEGGITFLLDSSSEDIKSLKLVVKAPVDNSLNPIGQPLTFNINLKGEGKVNTAEEKKVEQKEANTKTEQKSTPKKDPYYNVDEYGENGWRRPKDLKLDKNGFDKYGQNWADHFDRDDYPNKDPN